MLIVWKVCDGEWTMSWFIFQLTGLDVTIIIFEVSFWKLSWTTEENPFKDLVLGPICPDFEVSVSETSSSTSITMLICGVHSTNLILEESAATCLSRNNVPVTLDDQFQQELFSTSQIVLKKIVDAECNGVVVPAKRCCCCWDGHK